jgi:hypothetical protein
MTRKAARSGHLERRALASLGALLATLGCEEAAPKRSRAPSTAAAAPSVTANIAASAGEAVRIDAPPAPVLSEQRLRQQPRGGQLVIDTPGKWLADCSIHRPCEETALALEPCAPGRDAEAWGTLATRAERFTDPQVSVKGQLVMSEAALSTAVGCAKGHCCNRRTAKIVLAGPPYDLELVGVGCGGDESRLCCALSARGEEVIASGRLRYETGRLVLESPQLCRTEAN